jgi:hypothetical protein
MMEMGATRTFNTAQPVYKRPKPVGSSIAFAISSSK